MKNIFVTGTDTGSGKTVLSLLLMRFFHDKGCNPFYLKPFQTGCESPLSEDCDAAFVYRFAPFLKNRNPADSVIYCFKNPKAPYFAARDEECEIDPARIPKRVHEKKTAHSPIIIEAAGGLLVPVDNKTLMIDMITAVDAVPVIAARAGLGTINHTLLTLEALKTRGLKPAGIIMLDSGEKPTSKDMILENMEAVENASGMRVAGVIGKIDDFSNPGKECDFVIQKIF